MVVIMISKTQKKFLCEGKMISAGIRRQDIKMQRMINRSMNRLARVELSEYWKGSMIS